MYIMNARHQIVFISEQALVAVLGALFPRQGSVYMHFIVSSKMKRKTHNVQYLLEKKGVKCKCHFLNGEKQSDIFAVLEEVRRDCGDGSVAINLTGGTKLMSLAAGEWAQINNVPAFYFDTAHDELVLLPSGGRNWNYEPLPAFLDCRLLLESYGYAVERMLTNPVSEKLAQVARQLLVASFEFPVVIRSLNACAARAKNAPLGVVDDVGPSSEPWNRLLACCENIGMLKTDGKGHIRFPSEVARKWCNGLWLEDYVRDVLSRIGAVKRKGDFDWGVSVQIRKDGVPNELDAVFSLRNRLFIIECKTNDMDARSGAETGKATPILYKADSLHDKVGGVFANSILCTVLPLSRPDRKRANEMGIRVIEGRDLARLESLLLSFAERA